MQPIMKKGWIPDNAILVTADAERSYPSIPHNVGLRASKKAPDK